MTKHNAKLEFWLCLLFSPIINFFFRWWDDEYNRYQYSAWEFAHDRNLRF